MKPITAEWVRKAEDDWDVARKTYRARKIPVYDAACYHCQQCAEKYLKAKLVEAGIAFTKRTISAYINPELPPQCQ
ncbi:MAG: HEPN domain-containing protein [Acidobacteria bacterium]|nr:HEPN domain-containing protein [Acidobacteriota bacterium]MBI3424877.1 HEPN domain-containing protein [Acidobacteriota bacterium]